MGGGGGGGGAIGGMKGWWVNRVKEGAGGLRGEAEGMRG